MCEYLVEMKNISKRFQNVYTVKSIDFNIKHGEILGLLGENGAGKSVLMNILTGVYRPDEGEIFINGEKVDFFGPRDSQKYGISAIYQDINLADELSVGENIFLGRLPVIGKIFKRVDWNKVHSESESILQSLNFNINVRDKVGGLNPGQKQMVEIAKALSRNSKLIIMDEPYTGLSEAELESFFNAIVKLKDTGISIVYISHRIEDVLRVCDNFTVLREGMVVGDGSVSQKDRNSIIKLMVGKEIKDVFPKLNSKSGRVVLKVDSISTGRGLKNVSFNVRKGEILGIAGLLGSGRTAIARAIFGIDKLLAGGIYLNESQLDLKSPEDAIRAKIGYLVEDRQQSGLQMDFGIPENISLANLQGVGKYGILKLKREKNVARRYIKRFVIKTAAVEQKVKQLSGGNQQKVLLTRWIYSDSMVLILDEPTKGIDKSTKVELYNYMNKYVSEGSSIIFISSDIQELIGMSDRILVLFNGQIKRELRRNEFSEEQIIHYASGGE